MRLSVPHSDPLLKLCVLCEATVGVKLVDLFLRESEKCGPATKRLLCPECDDLLHWRTKERHRYCRSWERFGYAKDWHYLCPVEDEHQVIGEIIRLRVEEKLSYEAIAEKLNFRDAPSPSGGPWSGGSVSSVFEREAPNYGVEVESERISPTRYGYRYVDGRTVPDESQQQVLSWILEARARGATYKAIARVLVSKGVSTKRGGRWTPTRVYQVARQESAVRGIGEWKLG